MDSSGTRKELEKQIEEIRKEVNEAIEIFRESNKEDHKMFFSLLFISIGVLILNLIVYGVFLK